jgi:hypothetical protein
MRKHVKSYPFDTITFRPVLKIIEQHRATPWHVYRFGGGLPDRPKVPSPPIKPATHELPYIRELFRAYSDHEKTKLTKQGDLGKRPALGKHFQLTRKSFYSAESLREFSRDHLPDNEFGSLQDEIHDGIQEAYLRDHTSGYNRLLTTTESATRLQITDHALVVVLQPADKRGICHQLVNDKRLIWVEDNGKKKK